MLHILPNHVVINLVSQLTEPHCVQCHIICCGSRPVETQQTIQVDPSCALKMLDSTEQQMEWELRLVSVAALVVHNGDAEHHSDMASAGSEGRLTHGAVLRRAPGWVAALSTQAVLVGNDTPLNALLGNSSALHG